MLTISGLRRIAELNVIDRRGACAELFDRMIDHFDRIGWQDKIILADNTARSQTTERIMTEENNFDSEEVTQETRNVTLQINVQDIVSEVVQVLREQCPPNQLPASVAERAEPALWDVRSLTNGSVNSYQNWSQVKFISKLIPPFAGRRREYRYMIGEHFQHSSSS